MSYVTGFVKRGLIASGFTTSMWYNFVRSSAIKSKFAIKLVK